MLTLALLIDQVSSSNFSKKNFRRFLLVLLLTTTTTYQQRKWRAAPIKKFGSQIVIIHKNRFPAMFDDDMCAVNAANFSPRVGCQSGAVASQYSFLTAMDRPLFYGQTVIQKATGLR